MFVLFQKRILNFFHRVRCWQMMLWGSFKCLMKCYGLSLWRHKIWRQIWKTNYFFENFCSNRNFHLQRIWSKPDFTIFCFDRINFEAEDLDDSWVQFHQRVYAQLLSAQIPKGQKAAWLDCLFALLGSDLLKAACKHFDDEIDPWSLYSSGNFVFWMCFWRSVSYGFALLSSSKAAVPNLMHAYPRIHVLCGFEQYLLAKNLSGSTKVFILKFGGTWAQRRGLEPLI